MKKSIEFIVLSLFFFSCSGYFDKDKDLENDKALSPLAIQGGGYLSSDTANDITPFVYRDPDNGQPYLFFSSDRNDSNYNIYYAVMNKDGTFGSITLLNTNVNTSSNEYSPVVYRAILMGSTNTYITFIRQAGTNTNILTYRMSGGFNPSLFYEHATGVISATSVSYNENMLEVSLGVSNIARYIYSGSATIMWYSNATINLGTPVLSANSFTVGFFEFFILGKTNNQLSGFMYFSQTNGLLSFNTPAYSSKYRDITPYIDVGGGYKVYFASDRYGKGNFDLYRYNHVTFDKVLP